MVEARADAVAGEQKDRSGDFSSEDASSAQVTDEMTELEALNLAMDLERRSHQFFEAFAKQLTDPNGRKAFLDFAKAEENHLEELRAEYAAAGRRGR